MNLTAPEFLRDNPETVISLLWLDFDTYAPTVAALKHFVPRIPNGGVIAFDELNHEVWPDETVAVTQEVRLRNVRLERFPWGSTVCFAKLV